MKISLDVKKTHKKSAGVRPFTNISIKSSRYRIYGNIEVLIDTGSEITTISPRDITKLHIPLKIMKQENPLYSKIAGFKLPTFRLKTIDIKFITEENKLHTINSSHVDVLVANNIKKEFSHIPSIIGTNFLEFNKLTLYFNPYESL